MPAPVLALERSGSCSSKEWGCLAAAAASAASAEYASASAGGKTAVNSTVADTGTGMNMDWPHSTASVLKRLLSFYHYH